MTTTHAKPETPSIVSNTKETSVKRKSTNAKDSRRHQHSIEAVSIPTNASSNEVNRRQYNDREAYVEARKAYNRESAKRSREKQKDLIKYLREEAFKKQEEFNKAEHDNRILKEKVAFLTSHNESMLKLRYQTMAAANNATSTVMPITPVISKSNEAQLLGQQLSNPSAGTTSQSATINSTYNDPSLMQQINSCLSTIILLQQQKQQQQSRT